MFQSKACLPVGIAATLAILQPCAASADETEFWVELSASGEIAPGAAAKFEIEERRRDGANEYIVGAVVDFDIGNGFEVGGGMEIHDEDGFTEIRPYQQLTYSRGILSLRSRIEERFYDDADQMALRLRQRVRLRETIAPDVRASAAVELLYQLRDRNDGGPQRIDQWRLTAGLDYRAAPMLSLSGGYLYQIRPRDSGNTRRTHVPQVGVNYRF